MTTLFILIRFYSIYIRSFASLVIFLLLFCNIRNNGIIIVSYYNILIYIVTSKIIFVFKIFK